MVKRNQAFSEFIKSYLFVEIEKRKENFLALNPSVKLISLGVGDTTEPLPKHITCNLVNRASELGTVEGYSGYPEYNGSYTLRRLIADKFYPGLGLDPSEIFISDGSKPDLARLQLLFSSNVTVAVQNPVYPAYVDGSVISGKGGVAQLNGEYSKIVYMPCTPENNFFPDLTKVPRTDIIFFCSPNNPTGAVATKNQLENLVAFAKKNKSLLIYDSAYSVFIKDKNIPKTIFEIEGAKEVAFETSSFSKSIGFTGVRLGWTVCPKSLLYEDGTPVLQDWARIMGTCFNGPSNIAEAGGIATLSDTGLKEMRVVVEHYLKNASMIKAAMEELGYKTYGGVNSPYIWVQVPQKDSWEFFQEILEKAHVVTTPGGGFGSAGKNFIRLSAFASHENAVSAVDRLKKALKKIE